MDVENALAGPNVIFTHITDSMLIESLPVATCICDANGHITKRNHKTIELLGCKASATLAENITDLIKLYNGSRKDYNNILDLIHENEVFISQCDPEILVKARIGDLQNEHNEITGYIVCFEDITAFRHIQETLREADRKYEELIGSLERQIREKTAELQKKNDALQRSEERYHKMVEEVEDYAILLLDKDGYIQNWNKGAEKIKGYKESEIVGKHFGIFYLPEDQANNLPETIIERARNYGKAVHEGWRVRKNGTTFWGSIVITALHNEEGEIIGFSKVTRDLTERKYAEDRLRLYADELKYQNNELQQFAYVASHDLQEPLRKIKTFSDLLLSKYSDSLDEDGKNMLERMQIASDRMKALITDLLNYSRISQMIEKDLVNTAMEVNDVLTDLDTGIKDKKAVITIGKLYPVYGNNVQVRQLFQNLLSNALKFSKPGQPPHIDISGRIVQGYETDFDLPAEKLKSRFQYIEVRDNGIGFEQQYADKIFQVFQRLHGREEYKGSGIGLSIVQKVIENHNGYIKAEGKPGEGSLFKILLPF